MWLVFSSHAYLRLLIFVKHLVALRPGIFLLRCFTLRAILLLNSGQKRFGKQG